MNSVGLDVHKTRCVACIKTHEGRIVEEFPFQNNPHGHEELITHLKAYPEVQVAIESTGNLWIPIYNRLEDEHIHIVLTNPKKTRMIAEAKIKTDNHYEPFYQVKGTIAFLLKRLAYNHSRIKPHLPRIRSYEAHSLLKLRG